jgi:hypothetical protein
MTGSFFVMESLAARGDRAASLWKHFKKVPIPTIMLNLAPAWKYHVCTLDKDLVFDLPKEAAVYSV